jgi:large subunit ribosomal protein L25
MPDDVVLLAENRSDFGSGPAGRLRREGKLPGIVYGLGGDSTSVTVPAHELTLILAHGVNTLITLRLDGEDQLALARQVQRDPVRGDLVHVDFVRVRTDVAIAADVALHLLGESEGVKSGGLMDQQVFTVPIEAMPQNIPASIEVDVSEMQIGDQLRVADLPLPAGVVTSLEPDQLVATVVAQKHPKVATVERSVKARGRTRDDGGGVDWSEKY